MKPNQANTESAKAAARAAARERIARAAEAAPEALADRILAGDRVALSQGITLVESRLQGDRPAAERLLERVLAGRKADSLRIGITGIPGVGKSTFIERWGQDWIVRGHRVAVLAVDPSSGRSGGSILGDKTRMNALALAPEAFVRPSPAADTLGGVARATHEVMLLCEGAGYDRILVETVGVGQSETAVRNMTDLFLLMLIGGAGDDLQGIKRGIVEMADVVWINKAEGAGAARAKEAAQAMERALHLMPLPASGEAVPVLIGSGLTGLGMTELHRAVCELETQFKASGHLSAQRGAQQAAQMTLHVRHALWDEMMKHPGREAAWQTLQEQVENQELSAFSAARRFMETLK